MVKYGTAKKFEASLCKMLEELYTFWMKYTVSLPFLSWIIPMFFLSSESGPPRGNLLVS